MKATNEEILESYSRTRSVWKTAEEFKMCGQSIHERLQKLNAIKNDFFTEKEVEKIRNFYGKDKTENKNLILFAQELGRHKTNICRKAKHLGLTSLSRKKTKEAGLKISAMMKERLKIKGHPRGMLGKKHSKEYCDLLSKKVMQWWQDASVETKRKRSIKMLKTRIDKYGHSAPLIENTKTSWKQSWRKIGGRRLYCRSSWEANYARYLQLLKEKEEILDWEHESKTFWFEKTKQGAVSYLPDFNVIYKDGSYEWHEVKGWYDNRSKMQIKRFKKYYPTEKLVLVDANWFSKNSRIMRDLIAGWET